jgi:hypothetical protein
MVWVYSEVDFSTIGLKRSPFPISSSPDWRSVAGSFLVKTLKLAHEHQNSARQADNSTDTTTITLLSAPSGKVKFSDALLAWRTALVASYISATELYDSSLPFLELTTNNTTPFPAVSSSSPPSYSPITTTQPS